MVRLHYIETTDVATSTEAQVALAEALIDQYVGPQDRAYRSKTMGQVSAISGSNKVIADTNTLSQLSSTDGYYAGCHIEIVGGTGAGQIAYISDSSGTDKTITLRDAFSTTPDTTSVFRIFQLAKFPRHQDRYQAPAGQKYYRTIPQAVKDACIAQVQFIIAKGDAFFADDGFDLTSESFLNYSYTKASGSGGSQSAVVQLVSPQARVLLRGIYNRKGTMRAPGASNVDY